MSAPTSYTLRPSKNIERKMLCEAIARVARIAPLSRYRYVGFGGLAFQDFGIFHQRLGIKDMVSVERRKELKKRFEFNRPYSCVRIHWGNSHDVLPVLEWKKRAIVWLDYEGHLTGQTLADISLVASRVRSGSLLIVTVSADPGEDSSDPDAPKKRLTTLRDRIGKTRIPIDLKADHLSKWGTARVYRRIINDEIVNTIGARNAALAESEKVSYQQLFNFHYQDGSKMLTIGGVILNYRDRRLLGAGNFKDLSFIRSDDNEYLIKFPVLTLKETRLLDTRLPGGHVRRGFEWLPEADRLSYQDTYRYFPSFVEAEV